MFFRKLGLISISLLLILSVFAPTSFAASDIDEDFCRQFEGQTKIWWDGIELKSGQIGRLIVKQDTDLYKLDGDKKTYSRTLKAGEFYRIYAFKPGKLSVGGGYYVDRDTKVTYQTPSKTKLNAVKCVNGQFSSSKEFTTKEIVNLNDEKVVLIETDKAQGSGVVIGNGLILTNEHVMRGANSAVVVFNNGARYEVQGIVEADVNRDIAIIKTTKTFSTKGVVIKPSSKANTKGEDVVAIGSPVGLQNTVSEGIISGLRNLNGVSYIQTNADITFGSSGGGLFNVYGQLIGITTSGLDSNANLNYAVASEEFISLVNKYIGKTHSSIQASFPISSVSLIGKVALGMTKEEVKKLTTGTFYDEDVDVLYYQGVAILDYSANVIYEFKNNKLVAVNVYHDVVNNVNDLELLEAYFVTMYDKIRQTHGEADWVDTNWYDDGSDGYILAAVWEATDQTTLLITQITLDYDTDGGLRISVITE